MMLWLGSNAYTITINYCIQSIDQYMLINSLQKQTFFLSQQSIWLLQMCDCMSFPRHSQYRQSLYILQNEVLHYTLGHFTLPARVHDDIIFIGQ